MGNLCIGLLNFWPQPLRANRGNRGPDPLNPENPGFFDFWGVWGSGRHPRGSPEPVGVIVSNYRPKPSHMDPVRDILCIFHTFPGLVWLY